MKISELRQLIKENNNKYHSDFSIIQAYNYYELWAKGNRLETGSKNDIYKAFIKYRFMEKYKK